MFGIGMTELIVILVIALIIFGPKRLPELAKQLGKAMREFKKATDEVKENIGLDELDLNDADDGTYHGEDSPPSVEGEPPESTEETDTSDEESPEASEKDKADKPEDEPLPTQSPPEKTP